MNDACAPRPGAPSRIARALPAMFAIVAAFGFQGARGLYESSETRYAECAREMLAEGHWLQPTLAGQPHWTKPPLTYWAMAGGMALLGRNEWGVRLYGAVAFVVTVWGVTLLGRALWDERAGLVAGLIYATSLFAAGAANVATTDILVTLWEVLAVLAYWRAHRAPESSHARVWMMLMWAAFGVGFLTKGPPALLPLLAVVPFHLWMRRRGQPRLRLLSLPGLVLFGVVGLGWYAYTALRHPDLVEYLVKTEFWDRLTTNRFGRNPQWHKPFLLYLPPVALGLGLWVAFWPGLVWRTWGALRLAGLKRWLSDHPEAVFLALWLVGPLLLLFLVPSRLPLYVLPLMPIPALATARGLAMRHAGPGLGRTVWATAVVSAVLIVAGKGLIAHLPSRHDSRPLTEAMLAREVPGTRFAVLGRADKYGLDFYLDGRVVRVAASRPVAAPFDYDLDELVRAVKADRGRRSWVIAFKESAEPLAGALDRAGVPHTLCEVEWKYRLLVIPASSADAVGRREAAT